MVVSRMCIRCLFFIFIIVKLSGKGSRRFPQTVKMKLSREEGFICNNPGVDIVELISSDLVFILYSAEL